MTVRVAAVQLRSGARPQANAADAVRLVREAIAAGATYIQTPEVTNIVQRRRGEAEPFVVPEEREPTLAALRPLAAEAGVHIHVGSLVVREGERWRNRAYLIGPDGEIAARYDKIHMFDVDLPDGERFRESATFTPGETAVVAAAGALTVGLAICFDLRFPRLFEALTLAGADVLTVPAAFAVATGKAHWHALLRARAIENGAYLVAAAQEGTHEDGRTTFGHSMIVDPWGRILAEATETPSVITADVDLGVVATVRSQIPVLTARRPFDLVRAGAEERRAAV